MRPLSAWLYPAAVALFLVGGMNARAGLVSWTYNWEPSVTSLASDTGSGSMSLSDEPLGHATGNSDIVATNLHVSSTAPESSSDSFNNKPVTLTLTLTDTPSGQSGTLTFTGTFGGTFAGGHASVTFTPTGTLSKSLTLGNDTYTVNFGNYTPPPPPSAANAGSIGAQVALKTGGGSLNTTPEPGTMVMSLLGLSFLGLGGWCKWRRGQMLALEAI